MPYSITKENVRYAKEGSENVYGSEDVDSILFGGKAVSTHYPEDYPYHEKLAEYRSQQESNGTLQNRKGTENGGKYQDSSGAIVYYDEAAEKGKHSKEKKPPQGGSFNGKPITVKSMLDNGQKMPYSITKKRLRTIMLILDNLRKKENRIMADYYFPGNEAKGSVIYDAKKKEVIDVQCDDREPETIYGFRHLVKVLEMMVDNNKYPSYFEYYWY